MATLLYGLRMTGGYKTLLFLFLSLWISPIQAQEYDFSINWNSEDAVSITINEQKVPNLNIRLLGKAQKIAGSLSVEENTRFTPYFPFTIGATYQVFDGHTVLFTFIPQKEIVAPEVQNIYPLAEELPENFLKFYIEFDQPMATGHLYDHLRLFKNGKEIENAFIPLKPELWNSDKTIVTVWIDPGRIKRDLGPHKKFGVVLEEGNTYNVLIEKGLKAANGADLSHDFSKIFRAVKRDGNIPSVSNWVVDTPESGTMKAVRIQMQEAMDYATFHFIAVIHSKESVAGKWTFLSDTTISFKPVNPWQEGQYTLTVDSKAEDLAGNNFNRPFDRDLQKLPKVSEQEFYEIPFTVE